MNNNKEKSVKTRNIKSVHKIINISEYKTNQKNKSKDGIFVYKKYSKISKTKIEPKNKKRKRKKLRILSVAIPRKKIIMEETENKQKIPNFNENKFLAKKNFIHELSQRKILFSEKVKLIKLTKRNMSPKPRQETSFELIKKYSLKVLESNRSNIITKREKEKELIEKLEKIDSENLNDRNLTKSQRPKLLPSILKESNSLNNIHLEENRRYLSRNNYSNKHQKTHLEPINMRYLMIQYSENLYQKNQDKTGNLLNHVSNINISNSQSLNMNPNKSNIDKNIIKIIINNDKDSNNSKKSILKLKTEFSFKEYNYLNYAIVPGNASYLVKNCMCHRTNWKESFSNVTNMYNFKWQQNTFGINYSKLGKYGNIKQAVNHFENHFAISNKANMFINLMFYCEQRKISVFKFVPLTLIFELDMLINLDKPHVQKKLKSLQYIVEENGSKFVKNYGEIGSYFSDIKFNQEIEKRMEYVNNQLTKRNSIADYYSSSNDKKKNESEKKNFLSNYPTYVDYFGKPELIEKVTTTFEYNNDSYSKILKLEKEMSQNLGTRTLLEIPHTHYAGENMWLIKAINLCQGKCIQIVHNYNQMITILKQFQKGVDFNFTEKVIEEKEYEDNKQCDKEDKKDNKNKLDKSSLYVCEKVIIQKYIERPLLYNGRKCDMRVWVLVTHTMKVYFFKEGHLKTCSIPFNINSKDAYTHITNYSFQKHNNNFQKYEKGNEVPFHDFQKFIDDNYPEKNYKIKIDLYNQIKKIVAISMMSVKDQINKNNRTYQFEIFGYDFMLDEDFNLFLIEINDDPGLEESSPWIKIIVPRMLDDALRLTIDQIFYPSYDFSKNYKKNKIKEIKEYFEKGNIINKKRGKSDIKIKKNKINGNIYKERYLTEINHDENNQKLKNQKKNCKNYNKYISPFPVPGYNNNDNLWEFVCDLNKEDPLDKYLDKKQEENKYFTGIKYLYNKKKNDK